MVTIISKEDQPNNTDCAKVDVGKRWILRFVVGDKNPEEK